MVQHPFRVRWEVMDDWTWATYLKLGLVAVSLPTLLSGYFIDAIPASWGIYAGFAMSVVALVINEGFADPEFWEFFWSKVRPRHFEERERAQAEAEDEGAEEKEGAPAMGAAKGAAGGARRRGKAAASAADADKKNAKGAAKKTGRAKKEPKKSK